MGVATRDHAYEYGALWAIVDDPDELATDSLFQCLRGTRDYLGVLPTGRGRTSLFWSVRCSDMAAVQALGPRHLLVMRAVPLPARVLGRHLLAAEGADLAQRDEEALQVAHQNNDPCVSRWRALTRRAARKSA